MVEGYDSDEKPLTQDESPKLPKQIWDQWCDIKGLTRTISH